IVYNTYQMYSVQALPSLKKAFHRAVKYNYLLGVKIVRGAYLEKERKRAKQFNYPDPIHKTKEATDQDFNRALKFCVENKQRVALCAGTHNEYSTYYLTLLMEKYSISPKDPNFYFAQLYGMSDHISYNLARAGYNTAKYVPYGPIPSVMPYLFRRAKENTAVAGQSSRELSLIKRELHRRKTGKSAAGL
ncbi:MAG: proline dehydrogenase family protein, partial [Bacteroidota bacterium]